MPLDADLLRRLGNASTEFIDGWIGEHAPGGSLDGGELVSVLVTQLANTIARYPLERRSEVMNHVIGILVQHSGAPLLVTTMDATEAMDRALRDAKPEGRA